MVVSILASAEYIYFQRTKTDLDHYSSSGFTTPDVVEMNRYGGEEPLPVAAGAQGGLFSSTAFPYHRLWQKAVVTYPLPLCRYHSRGLPATVCLPGHLLHLW